MHAASTASTTSWRVVRDEADAAGVPLERVAYVGNDVNDAACLEAVGLPVVPADAWPEVVPLARWVLERPGGHGCVRELCGRRVARPPRRVRSVTEGSSRARQVAIARSQSLSDRRGVAELSATPYRSPPPPGERHPSMLTKVTAHSWCSR